MTADRTENPQESLDALNEYLKHKNVAKACRALGIGRSQFDTAMARIGLKIIQVKVGRANMKTARNMAIAELYASGKTMGEVGLAHGMTRERVRQILGRLGVASRKKGCCGPRKNYHKKLRLKVLHPRWITARQRDADVPRLYGQGLTAEKIAQELNISRIAVYKILERVGVPRRSKGRPRVGAVAEPAPVGETMEVFP